MRDDTDRPTTVPAGRAVRLPGRGTTFVRDVAGPDGAPTVVLLHGLGATGAMNWPGAFGALSPHFRVLALDQRGHGRGIRSARPFRLEDCADDVLRLADALEIEHVIAAGYSMGGPVALLARRRHPSRISGLVLCATAARFGSPDPRTAAFGSVVATSLRLTPPALRRQLNGSVLRYLGRDSPLPPALVEEVRRHDPAALLEASRALGNFDARPWLGQLCCPTSSIVTTRDGLVPPARQLELAQATGARVHRVDADHLGAVRDRARFLPALRAACRFVANAGTATAASA